MGKYILIPSILENMLKYTGPASRLDKTAPGGVETGSIQRELNSIDSARTTSSLFAIQQSSPAGTLFFA
jgi:hypothetical protein